ncbi:MAG TPA: RdgB/HAM1 family non-canonical purine NTP pyrophosphatase [Pyrinomonadaceae bacterium]|nr:RdgB/HAM1 family non-canonical purine NTP pyrophosphatase [Pyrinomonadaceae bacterium]
MLRTTPLDLLIATGNAGKVAEIRAVLGDLPINFRTLTDFPEIGPVEESGSTYEENAVLKARAYAQQTGLWALADDSGFEVKALAAAPGVFSARYAGEGASDSDRIAFLLRQLDRVSSMDRDARFVCVAALADSTSSLVNVEYGVCEGLVIDNPRGEDGFGYDPIFVPEGFDKTFAELPRDVKNAISHRARALHLMRPFLEQLVASE